MVALLYITPSPSDTRWNTSEWMEGVARSTESPSDQPGSLNRNACWAPGTRIGAEPVCTSRSPDTFSAFSRTPFSPATIR